jgi:hypothetical protein
MKTDISFLTARTESIVHGLEVKTESRLRIIKRDSGETRQFSSHTLQLSLFGCLFAAYRVFRAWAFLAWLPINPEYFSPLGILGLMFYTLGCHFNVAPRSDSRRDGFALRYAIPQWLLQLRSAETHEIPNAAENTV